MPNTTPTLLAIVEEDAAVALYALSAFGWILWSYTIPHGSMHALQVMRAGVAIVTSNQALHVLASGDGRILWINEAHRFASRIVANDGTSLFALTPGGLVLSLEASTGMQYWQAHIEGTVCVGLVATPALLFVAFFNGTIYALDTESGRVIWRTSLSDVIMAPIIQGEGLLYAILRGGNLIAICCEDGTTVWETRPGYHGPSGPAFARRTVFLAAPAQGHSGVLAVSAADGAPAFHIATDRPVLNSLAVSDQVLVFAETGGRKNFVTGADIVSGQIIWRRTIGYSRSPLMHLALTPQAVCMSMSDDNGLRALRASDGRPLWQRFGRHRVIGVVTYNLGG